jgi:serine/threonine protein kinase
VNDKEHLEELLAQAIDTAERTGSFPDIANLETESIEVAKRLRSLLETHQRILDQLGSPADSESIPQKDRDEPLPEFEGFRTIERIGRGGMGEVFKLEDLQLGRVVAGKRLRENASLRPDCARFLREAQTLALFSDPSIVQVFEFRADDDPPLLIMEYVDGFHLDRIGPALEVEQRARLVAEICDAVHRAHELGLQHRDLKPANIMVDAALKPKILDFGLSESHPRRGHGQGTLAYIAPEQLDPRRDIESRTDIYAIGVVLYELLCGKVPFCGQDDRSLIESIVEGAPLLPAEIDSNVPEPLQAIALKAMEKNPSNRYVSAAAMAEDLRRFLDGLPVHAKPTVYGSVLADRVRPHLDQIGEWLRLRLIFPHEAESLGRAYQALSAGENDWLVSSRRLSLVQISLHLGAFVLLLGGLLYFVADRFHGAVEGLVAPTLTLWLPFLVLTTVAFVLEKRGRTGMVSPLLLGGVSLLPFAVLIFLGETGLWAAVEEQLFDGEVVSNRQIQVAMGLSSGWAFFLALRTRTIALASALSGCALFFALAVLADFGLRTWLEEATWDTFGFHLVPVAVVFLVSGLLADRKSMPWLAAPLQFTAAGLFVIVLEIIALDGKAMAHLGLTTEKLALLGDPVLLDTVIIMTVNGVLFFLTATLLDLRGTETNRRVARVLYVISPFAMLEPLGYLVQTGEFVTSFNWIYLGLAVVLAYVSRLRQRKSFFFAGLFNAGAALLLITDRHEWFDVPAWAVVLVASGIALVLAGILGDRFRRDQTPGVTK